MRGAGNSCRSNAKYACNFLNIRSGKCPGYEVVARGDTGRPEDQEKIKVGDKTITVPKGKYKMRWKNATGEDVDLERGDREFWWGNYDEWGKKGQKGKRLGGNAEKYRKRLEQWNEKRCLPLSDHDDRPQLPPNFYCLPYRNRRGCSATQKDNRRVGVYKTGGVTPAGTRRKASTSYKQRRYKVKVRGDGGRDVRLRQKSSSKSDSLLLELPPAAPSPPRRQGSSVEGTDFNDNNLSSSSSAVAANLVEKKISRKGKKMRILGTPEHHNLLTIKLAANKGEGAYGLFAKKRIPVHTNIPYLGKELTAQENRALLNDDRNNQYLVEAEFRNDAGKQVKGIDGNPKKGAVSWAVFANEPTKREKPNAQLIMIGGRPFLQIRKAVPKGKEVLVCYGERYSRDYETSCKSGGEPARSSLEERTPFSMPLPFEDSEDPTAQSLQLLVEENPDVRDVFLTSAQMGNEDADGSLADWDALWALTQMPGTLNEERILDIAQLHTDGYVVIKNAFDVSGSEFYEEMSELSKTGETIFNPDRRRKQRYLDSNLSRRVKKFINQVHDRLKEMFPNHKPSDMTILRSEKGCRPQQAHSDYRTTDIWPNEGDIRHNDEMPLGVIIALQDNTKLDVWPRSIGEMLQGPIAPKHLKFDRGDMVIFRGDLIHAGSKYDEVNVRVHTYLDHPAVKRKANSTNFVEFGQCLLPRSSGPEVSSS